MATEEVLKAEKGIAFSIDRVIMDQGTYPKLWRKGGAESAEEKEDDDDEEAPVQKSNS
jgi:hypothetical protein